MLSTGILVAAMAGVMVVSFTLRAFLLWLGLRWASVSDATLRRVVAVTLLLFLLQSAISGLLLALTTHNPAAEILLSVIELILNLVVIPFIVIARFFRTPPRRTFKAWLPTLLAPVLIVAFTVFMVRPFTFQAFSVPTNAMAPTILGHHWQATCPTCGSPAYFTPPDERFPSREAPPIICRDNFHVTESAGGGEAAPSNDRILVAKFLRPQRWDVVAFQFPEDPSVMYVKRLVGMPGEEITIRDGIVWADGVALTPPEHLRGLEYLDEMPYPVGPIWGSPERPARLAEDEYFMLGDFSRQSADSRLWESGAPGYHPYAVPETYLKGVVTHIYWPVSRWRILR